ncbi:MAG TPA: dTMP kinase [Candidatus Acidoferrales bacterium]|nr:dTMP kinase [Candidatus Acidoferrales bacterium]
MKYHVSFDIDFKRNNSKGQYIAIEGIDGSGKTTQVDRLVAALQKEGKEVIKTREPRKGVGLIGKLIEDILHGKTKISPVAFQYLFTADRQMQHHELILPALKAGKVVVSDRCFWSAIPYGLLDYEEQIEANSIQQKLVAQSILSFYHEFTIPDKTFYLDVALDTAIERITNGDGADEIYEDRSKLKRAIEGYQWLLKEFPDEFTAIDASQSVGEVSKGIRSVLEIKD